MADAPNKMRVVLLCACCALGAASLCAQKAGGLAGRLTDDFAHPLGQTLLVARNVETGAEVRTTTEDNGSYRFKDLAPGEYLLAADSTELGHGEVDGVLVTSGHMTRVVVALKMTLPPPKPVMATLHDLTPTTMVLKTEVASEELKSLPVTSRNWSNFALETPQASMPSGNLSAKSLDTAGQNPGAATSAAEFRVAGELSAAMEIDGMDLTPGFKSQGWGRTSGAPMAEAALERMEVQAGNGEIEAGHAATGEMKAHSAHGTDGLHGQAFVYDRGNFFTALNPYTQNVLETSPATSSSIPVFTPFSYSPNDLEVTWGAGVGGAIRKSKLFWFGAFDGYARNNPGVASLRHEDLFFAQPALDQMELLATQLGQTGNAIAQGTAAYSQLLESLDALLGPAPRSATQWIGFGRVDWQQTERDHWMAEGNIAQWNAPGGALTRTSETYGNHSFGTGQASEDWAMARWEHYVTENLLAVTQGSWSREVLRQLPGTPSAFEQQFLINEWGRLPQITVDSSYGFNLGSSPRFGAGAYPDERRVQASEQLNWVHRANLVKAGFELGHIQDDVGVLLNQAGTYSYSSAVDFASDALTFLQFGLSGELDPYNQHNCDPTRSIHPGGLGLGYLPCYSHYSQTMGPSGWSLSTNDWAGYVTEQWQFKHHLTLSAALRWEREQLPPPIARVANPALPGTGVMPALGNDWGPRLSMAWAPGGKHWPILRAGYGIYYGRTQNATIETVLTHTGSLNGDLNFFLRPTDNLNGGGAPPFPYVFAGEPINLVKPGAVEFDPHFKNPEVHQGLVAVEEELPGQVMMTASALVSLGRRLPVSLDTNIDPAVNPGYITFAVCENSPTGTQNSSCANYGLGPIKDTMIQVPFYASWPAAACPAGSEINLAGQCGRLNANYQQITDVMAKANSTYEAAMVRLTRVTRKGLVFRLHYSYAHAMDWNPNETTLVAGSDVLDPQNFQYEYGTSDLDVRHSASGNVEWLTPWKAHGLAGLLGNKWSFSTVGHYASGRPYTMRTSGSLDTCVPPGDFCMPYSPAGGSGSVLAGAIIPGLGPGINGSGGDNRIYGTGVNDHHFYFIGRNTYRYPSTWSDDLRLGKRLDLGKLRDLELMAESFNLFNHENVTELETTGYTIRSGSTTSLPTLNFLTGYKQNTTAFGQPLDVNATNFFRPREFELGARLRF